MVTFVVEINNLILFVVISFFVNKRETYKTK